MVNQMDVQIDLGLDLLNMMVSPGKDCLDILMEMLESLDEYRRKAMVSNILEELVIPVVMVRFEANDMVSISL